MPSKMAAEEMFFLVPVGPDFEKSVMTPVDLNSWDDRPDGFSSSERIWGVKPGEVNDRNWNRLTPGDWLLFYRMGMGKYVALGRTGVKAETNYFSENVWEDKVSRRIYMVDCFDTSTFVRRTQLNSTLGYPSDMRPTSHWYADRERGWPQIVKQFDVESSEITI